MIPRTLAAEFRTWNAEIARARAEYYANPITSRGRRSNVSDSRAFLPCVNNCGRVTRAQTGVCLICRKPPKEKP